MSYGKVHDVFWDDDKIEALSDRAAMLGLFLITGRHRNAIGCFKLGSGAITDIRRFGAWGIEGVSDALRELSDMGFIVRDEKTGWTFIVNALKHDPIKGGKAAIHAAKLALAIPSNSNVYQKLREKLEPQLESELKGQKSVHGWPMRSPIDTPSNGHAIPKPSPEPSPEPSPKPKPSPNPEPVRSEVGNKNGIAKERAPRASDPEVRKQVWEQKVMEYIAQHWSEERRTKAFIEYIEGSEFGKAEFEAANTEMRAVKTDGSLPAESRLDRDGALADTLEGFNRMMGRA